MKRRLLFAAAQAYQPKAPIAGRDVGWLEPPQVVHRALPATGAGIDLALVGRVREGVLVAYRGSLPPFYAGYADGWTVLLDWLNDGLALCIEDAEFGGGVHWGFAQSARRLWADHAAGPGVRSLVDRLLARSRQDRRSGARLFIAGHSKGGAIANLSAMLATKTPGWATLPISVGTIGAARAGDARFARAYAATRIACLRWELTGDWVPQLPPGRDTPGPIRAFARSLVPSIAGTDWQPVGLRIAPETRVRHGRWAGSRRVLPGKGARLAEMLMPDLLKAHAICPMSGYDRLICAGEDCDHGRADSRLAA
ncbi:hypothetical protein AB2M62_15035 [Sphingomonas sp. MMS12-HWE2-04]|uniref:lipase family protein n=1 Tax=Sphingomonas sp. MMS12-HWE2-04 TaxID=3234199 RepID=UPI00384E3F05